MNTSAIDEDVFNLEVRKFLKQVGIHSQREIERAVREAQAAGKLAGQGAVPAQVTLAIPALGVSYRIDGEIALR